MFKDLKVKYGKNEYIVKFNEHKGYVTVKLHSTKFPFKQLNKNIEYTGYYLLGKETLVKDAIYKYEHYKDVANAF